MMRRRIIQRSCSVGALLVALSLTLVAGSAHAVKIDTLTDLPPGTTIGCEYTFKNGDPSIPCAQDTVADDGTVSFVKPNAPFDNIEYFMIPPVGPALLILKLETPIGEPILDVIMDGSKFPILTPDGTFDSFFDVFVTIDLPTFSLFDSNQQLGLGSTCSFIGGISDGCPGIAIESFTGDATVAGFDLVSVVAEPASIGLFLTALAALTAINSRFPHRRRGELGRVRPTQIPGPGPICAEGSEHCWTRTTTVLLAKPSADAFANLNERLGIRPRAQR